MNEQADFNATEEHPEPQPPVAHPLGAGAPLSPGVSRHGTQSPTAGNRTRFVPTQPAREPDEDPPQAAEFPAMQRAANILRTALPLMQRLLPLLDGNFATAIGNLISSRAHPQANRQSAKIDLAPIEDSLTDLRAQQHSLRLQATEQDLLLKKVEDDLEKLREATSRNILEQQETFEDLKSLGNRIKVIAVIALLLAAAGLATTVALFLRMNKMLL